MNPRANVPTPEHPHFPSPPLSPRGKRAPTPPLTPTPRPADSGSAGLVLSGSAVDILEAFGSQSIAFQSGEQGDAEDFHPLFDDADMAENDTNTKSESFTRFYDEEVKSKGKAASEDEMEISQGDEDETSVYVPAFEMVDGRIEFGRRGGGVKDADEMDSSEDDEGETSEDDEYGTSTPAFKMDDDRIEMSGYGAGDAVEDTGSGDAHAPSTDTAQTDERRKFRDVMTTLENRYNQPGPSLAQPEHSDSQAGLSSIQAETVGSTASRLDSTPDPTDEPSGSTAQFADDGIEALISACGFNPACIPKFEKFLELPLELRERIYSIALSNEALIRPHLCDLPPSGSIKFHDAARHSRVQPNHGSINKLLGITRVSKAIRDESLKYFYSSNTFTVDADTPTYFARLQNLSRFHMIRNVQFRIHMNSEIWTAQYLEQMTTYLKAAEEYELSQSAKDGNAYEVLVNHPRYNASGLNEMALMICTRMLTSTFPSTTTFPTFVLPIPSAADFTKYAGLRWFPDVCRGLGINLRFLEGHELDYNEQGIIGVTWHQKFQKKEFGNEKGEKGGAEVRMRALEMFSDLENRIRWDRCSYYRVSCDGNRMGWFEVKT
jgi:hypothetical protein